MAKLKELIKGFEYENKQAFLEWKHLEFSSINNYISFLNKVTIQENKYLKCIFKLDDKEIDNFTSTLTVGSISSMSSILKAYHEYYVKFVDDTATDKVCEALKSLKKNPNTYLKEVTKYVTSINELIDICERTKISKRSTLGKILTYIGFNTKEIVSLKVVNVDFNNKTISYFDKTYTNVDDRILSVIRNNINDIENKNEFLMKALKGKEQLGSAGLSRIIGELPEDKTLKRSITKEISYDYLRNAGILSYYSTHEDEFIENEITASKVGLLKLYGKLTPSATRYSIGGDELINKVNVFKQNAIDTTPMFNVQIEVTDDEIKRCKTAYNQLNSAESKEINNGIKPKEKEETDESIRHRISKSYTEQERKNDDKKPWYDSKKESGNANEKLVFDTLKSTKGVESVTYMMDFSGYDLRFNIGETKHRLEVKTLSSNLEFMISINEINSIFDDNKDNYSIAVVRNDEIYIIEDVERTLNLDRVIMYKINNLDSCRIYTETFVIKLNNSLFNKLKTFDNYIKTLVEDIKTIV